MHSNIEQNMQCYAEKMHRNTEQNMQRNTEQKKLSKMLLETEYAKKY